MKKVMSEVRDIPLVEKKENRDPYSGNLRILEEWKPLIFEDIKPGLYMISSLGRVYSLVVNRELSYLPSGGYVDVALQTTDNKRKTYSVHRLVSYTFHKEFIDEDKPYVNHINTIRDDNAKYNLEFVTAEENLRHAIEFYNNNPHMQPPKDLLVGKDNEWGKGELTYGENNGMSVWTEEQVHIMCKALEDGLSYKEALELAGIPYSENNRDNLSHIAQGVRWGYISKQYNIKTKKHVDYTQYIIPVCELLQEKKYSDKQIGEILGIPGPYSRYRGFIGGIRRRENYTDISCNYIW